jgi:hypothetical protein
MRYVKLLLILFIALISTDSALGQPPKLTLDKDAKELSMNISPARWTSPEILLNDLRSDDDTTRLKALILFGLTKEQAQFDLPSANGKPSEKGVDAPDQVQLRYATLGEDGTQQAILSAELHSDTEYVAVATPVNGGWNRVGVFSCWCKYERGDIFTTFVHLQPAAGIAQTMELVLHASGGGTGLYEQTESRFRMHDGKLVRVASFISREMYCPVGYSKPQPCTLDRRWFYWTVNNGVSGGILLEGYARFTGKNDQPVEGQVRDLEIRELQRVTCTGFNWNDQQFRYEQVKLNPDPCVATPH